MFKHLLAAALASLIASAAIAAPTDTADPRTNVRLRDLSGTNLGPFVPETMCVDGNGNACSFGATPTAPGTSGSTATPVQGVTGGVPQSVSVDQTTPGTTNNVTAGVTRSVCTTPTITASTYTSGQELGPLLVFANAFGSLGRGVLQSVAIDSKTKQAAGTLRLYPFPTNPSNTTWTDHSTPAINAADVFAVRTPTDLTTPYSDLGTHTTWGATGMGQAIGSGSTTLYGVLVATSALSAFGGTTDVQVCVKTLSDN